MKTRWLVLILLLAAGTAMADTRFSVGVFVGSPGYGYWGPPPPPRVIVPPCPGPGYLWVPGYWYGSGPRYSWRSGYWRPPARHGGYYRYDRYDRHDRWDRHDRYRDDRRYRRDRDWRDRDDDRGRRNRRRD